MLQQVLDQKIRELAALNNFMKPFLEHREESEDAFRWLTREMAQATERIADLMRAAGARRASL